MNAKTIIVSAGTAVAAARALRSAGIDLQGILETIGLSRQRNHWLENIALLGIGAAVGAGAAMLLTPLTGEETRKYVGENASRLGQAARDIIREARSEST